ncbi:hypothetical protein BDW22DRAFT_274125 [Trametopsis cervina]|nr:hypothetical protein BDW22DRAFT_274125 [Trametopsis cervina]
MEPGPIFMKLRAIAFSCMLFVGLVWLVLLSVELFLRWDISDPAQRSLVVVFVMIETVTVILLPAMLIVPFRVWLDATRMLALVLAHYGVAIAFTVKNASFVCPDQTLDDDGVCELIDTYIMLGSWVIPGLLLAYLIGFCTLIYRRRNSQDLDVKEGNLDIEGAVTPTAAEIPIMPPPPTRARMSASTASSYPSTASQHVSFKSISRPTWLDEDPSVPKSAVSVAASGKEDDTTLPTTRWSRSSARLSKRLPADIYM